MQGFTIALQGDEGFQRFLARKVILEAELEVGTSGEIYRGFVTGLDSEWLQITTTKDQDAILLRLGAVEHIRDTGSRLDSLPSDAASRVRKFARTISRVAEQSLAASGDRESRA